MDETLKILLAIAFGALYFWVLSRRKKKPAKPDEIIPPVTKIIAPNIRPKTTFGKVLADLENSIDKEISQLKGVEVSKSDIKNPLALMRKEKPVSMSISEEKKLKAEIKERIEGGKKRASEKIDDFNAEVDADDLMNDLRDKAYKLQQNTEHPIVKLSKDADNLKNAVILAEILQKKH
jgi:hypothetical protein